MHDYNNTNPKLYKIRSTSVSVDRILVAVAADFPVASPWSAGSVGRISLIRHVVRHLVAVAPHSIPGIAALVLLLVGIVAGCGRGRGIDVASSRMSCEIAGRTGCALLGQSFHQRLGRLQESLGKAPDFGGAEGLQETRQGLDVLREFKGYF